MKKIYEKPQMTTMKLESSESILVESQGEEVTKKTVTGNVTGVQGTESGDFSGSSVWED